jgi:hypothetical protein
MTSRCVMGRRALLPRLQEEVPHRIPEFIGLFGSEPDNTGLARPAHQVRCALGRYALAPAQPQHPRFYHARSLGTVRDCLEGLSTQVGARTKTAFLGPPGPKTLGISILVRAVRVVRVNRSMRGKIVGRRKLIFRGIFECPVHTDQPVQAAGILGFCGHGTRTEPGPNGPRNHDSGHSDPQSI